MSDDPQPFLKRIRRPLVLATVGVVFLAFVAWFGPQLRDDLWFMRFDEGCKRGDVDACAAVGWRHMTGSGAGIDHARGHSMLDDACRNHDVIWACAAVGNTHWWQRNAQILLTAEQSERAIELCDQGTDEACDIANIAGLEVTTTVGQSQTRQRCLDGEPVACWAILDEFYLADSPDDLEAACELGFEHACPGALHDEDGEQFYKRLYWLGVRSSYENQDERYAVLNSWATGETGTDETIERLAEMCVRDASACVVAAKLRAKRADVLELAQDWELARPYYERACNNDSRWGCWGLGKFREQNWWQAELLEDQTLKLGPKPPSEAYERACALGYHRSCVDAAKWLSEEAGDNSLYRIELEEMCKGGKLAACDALIIELRDPRYGDANPERADTIQAAVCDAGSDEHCDHWLFGYRRP